MPDNLPSTKRSDVSPDIATDIATDHYTGAGNLSLVDIPLIEGEDAGDLEQFRTSAIDAIKPRDAIEAIWLQDFICYAWESMRLRRQKSENIINTRAQVLYNRLLHYSGRGFDRDYADHLTRKWAAGDITAKEEVKPFLEQHSFSESFITAKTFELSLEDIAKFDKLISHYDQRRDSAIKELEKRRDILARRAYIFAQTFQGTSIQEDESAS